MIQRRMGAAKEYHFKENNIKGNIWYLWVTDNVRNTL